MPDYLKLSAAALSAYGGYKTNQADTSSARMADFYRGRASDMLAEAQALAILAMAEAVVCPPVTVTTERTENARLTALEAGPQAQPVKISHVEHLAAEVERLTAELDAARAERDNLAAERKRLDAENAMLAADIDELTRQHDNLGNALDKAADKIRQLTAERDCRRTTDSLAVAEVDRLIAERNALAAEVDGLRNVNAGLRQDNASQSELIAALR